jgi:tetratricopeptide (TPR) repeat protein
MVCFTLLVILWLAPASQPANSLVQEARSDFHAGKYLQARGLLLQALKTDSQNPALWRYLALTDARLNQIDRAISDFRMSLRLDPNNAQTCFGLGLLYRLKGSRAQAIAMYQNGLKLDPSDPQANRHYALILMSAAKYREAIPPLEKSVKADPHDSVAHSELVQCYVKSHLAQAAESEVHQFLALPGTSADAQMELAKTLAADKTPELEQEVLRHTILTAPDSAEAHAMLGTLLANQRHFDEAGQQLWDAVKLSPDSPRYALEFAGTLILWKRYAAALKFLMLVKDRFGNLPEYQYKLGLAYNGLREYPQAIDIFQSLARRHPNLAMVQYSLGNCYYSQSAFTKAEEYYQHAIQLNAHNALFYSAMGELLRKETPPRTNEAILNLQKALQLNPAATEARFHLALCFEDQREFTKALPLLQQVVRDQPGLLSAHIVLARTYYQLKRRADGDREMAVIAQLQDSTQRKPVR